MTRRFNKRQRLLLAMRSGGRCESCGTRLVDSFHADHVIPWSKQGKTTTANGAALCELCNLRKGNKMKKNDRVWQVAATAEAINCFANIDKHYAVLAAPGAGKTRMAIMLATELFKRGMIDRVVVIAPRNEIVSQWAKEFKAVSGRAMMKITRAMNIKASEIENNIVATWSGIRGISDVVQDLCRTSRVLVVADEVHHAALSAAWGTEAGSCMSDCKYVLALSGTPHRSDGKDSVWISEAISSMNFYAVSYAYAIDQKWCAPAVFHRHSGNIRTVIEGHTVEVSPGNTEGVEDLPAAIRANAASALTFEKVVKHPHYESDGHTPMFNSYHGSMLEWAHRKLDDIRSRSVGNYGMPNAGALIIAPNIEMADYFAKLINMKWPDEHVTVVHSDNGGSAERIEQFRNSERKWIVSVNMISEGVDIHRLRVMILLPTATTEMYFRQAVGRVIRKREEHDNSRAYVVIPEIDALVEYALRVESEMGEIKDQEESKPREKREPSEWECSDWSEDGCGTINVGGSRCHCCGLPRNQSFDVSIESAIGNRDGVITRETEVTEEEVIEGERIAEEIRKNVAAQKDARLFDLLSALPPELLVKAQKVFTAVLKH